MSLRQEMNKEKNTQGANDGNCDLGPHWIWNVRLQQVGMVVGAMGIQGAGVGERCRFLVAPVNVDGDMDRFMTLSVVAHSLDSDRIRQEKKSELPFENKVLPIFIFRVV